MYRSILVPLDGSVLAEWALPTAISIARRHSSEIELLTVERLMQTALPDLRFSDRAEAWRGAAEDETLTYLAEVQKRVRAIFPLVVKRQVRVGIGTVADQVLQHARDSECDLIVMATHGYGLLKRFWLGSVADGVVRHSPVATLLVRPVDELAPDLNIEPGYRNILIPLDGSAAAQTILDHALAVGGKHAQYTIVQALSAVPVLAPEYALVTAQEIELLLQTQQETAQTVVDTAAERLRSHDPAIHVRTNVLTGNNVAGDILDYASQNAIDLIAMTTHGHGGAVRLMLGSVADKVTRGAQVPVLLYRPA